MTESVSADFVRQVRLALEVLAGETSMSPTDELSALISGGGSYGLLSLSGVQVTDLLAGDHIEIDTINDSSGDILVSTGAGQANGLITLPIGKVFILSASWQIGFTGPATFFNIRWRNNTDAVLAGIAVNINPETQTSDVAGLRATVAIIDATLEAKEVEVRIIGNVGANRVEGVSSRILIHQV